MLRVINWLISINRTYLYLILNTGVFCYRIHKIDLAYQLNSYIRLPSLPRDETYTCRIIVPVYLHLPIKASSKWRRIIIKLGTSIMFETIINFVYDISFNFLPVVTLIARRTYRFVPQHGILKLSEETFLRKLYKFLISFLVECTTNIIRLGEGKFVPALN